MRTEANVRQIGICLNDTKDSAEDAHPPGLCLQIALQCKSPLPEVIVNIYDRRAREVQLYNAWPLHLFVVHFRISDVDRTQALFVVWISWQRRAACSSCTSGRSMRIL